MRLQVTIKQKIETILSEINKGLVGRKDATKAALLTMLCGENLVLIGPPGTAKSMVARRIADCIESDDDNKYFEYLLTKFSTPEEIFGPLSISELKADRFKRNTNGYLPSAKVAFLDEIFKSSSSILNSLLTILNERIFHNGSTPQKVPLLSLVSASNELPVGEEELAALYDRFLVRIFVGYVDESDLHLLFADDKYEGITERIGIAELEYINKAASEVVISETIIEIVRSIWKQHKAMFKEDNRESLSDRRLKKVIWFLRVCAATNGRSEVDLSDLSLLKNCLWNHYDNAEKIQKMMLTTLRKYSYPIPSSDTSSGQADKPIELMMSRQAKGTIKGFMGSGTQQDPILISSPEDLASMDDFDISMQGYYFYQSIGIDCSSLTHWKPIKLKGHYNGGGYTIKLNRPDSYVFETLESKSRISDLTVTGASLVKSATDSIIERCKSNYSIAESVAGCEIISCSASNNLIYNEAKNTKIQHCRSNKSLAVTVDDCKITLCRTMYYMVKIAKKSNFADCIVVLNQKTVLDDGSYIGGVVCEAEESLIERCFVTGSFKCESSGAGFYFSSANFYFGGISGTAYSTTISHCAVGKLKISDSGVRNYNRIITCGDALMQDNVAIDTLKGENNASGKDGKTVAAAIFNQRYFEHTLGWDFVNIWEWNNANNTPTLKQQEFELNRLASLRKKYSNMGSQANHKANTSKVDLLVSQMRSNIWI